MYPITVEEQQQNNNKLHMDHFKQYFKSKNQNQNEQEHSIKILREVNKCENKILSSVFYIIS